MDEIWLTGNESQLTKLEVFNIRTLGSLKRTPRNQTNGVVSLNIFVLNRLMAVYELKYTIIVMCNRKCILLSLYVLDNNLNTQIGFSKHLNERFQRITTNNPHDTCK